MVGRKHVAHFTNTCALLSCQSKIPDDLIFCGSHLSKLPLELRLELTDASHSDPAARERATAKALRIFRERANKRVLEPAEPLFSSDSKIMDFPAPANPADAVEEEKVTTNTTRGTTSLDKELELREQGFSTVAELAREFNRSKPGLFVLLQQKKVTKREIPGIRAAFYNVAEAVERIGPKGVKHQEPSALDFEKDSDELDAALIAAGRPDLAQAGPSRAVQLPAMGGGVKNRTRTVIGSEIRIRPITRLLARQAIICERSGLHEAERVLLWLTVKSAGLLKPEALRPRSVNKA
jgi:hypothetical protein